jgi:hypothetical protein
MEGALKKEDPLPDLKKIPKTAAKVPVCFFLYYAIC